MTVYLLIFTDIVYMGTPWIILSVAVQLGADSSIRKAIRDAGLWEFITVRQIYPLINQS